ncbi:chitinase-3-like protein 1 [Cetorhinus maximus]
MAPNGTKSADPKFSDDSQGHLLDAAKVRWDVLYTTEDVKTTTVVSQQEQHSPKCSKTKEYLNSDFTCNLSSFCEAVSSYTLLCYYLEWSPYRFNDIMFYPENIDPCLCTHLIYSHANTSDDISQWADEPMYKSFNDLKDENKNLKTLLGFGGWNFGTHRFSSLAAKQETRATFINASIIFLRKHRFDGLDLDWRFPAYRGNSPEQKRHFTILIKELMEAFKTEAESSGRDRLLLTAPVAVNKMDVDAGYDIAEVSRCLDFISLMTFNFHGVWNKFTGHNSPLYRGSADRGIKMYFNIDYILKYWRDKGAPSEKLLVAFPAYGNTYTLNTSQTGVGAPVSGGGQPGPYTHRPGFLAYHEICPFLENATIKLIDEQKVPYAFKGDQWVGYDNRQSFTTKAQWVKDNNFGGAVVWALNLDDYDGTRCDEGFSPLTNTLKSILGIDGSGCEQSPEMPEPCSKSTTKANIKFWC